MKQKWIWHPVEKRLISAHEYVRPPASRSHLPSPTIITDHMKPVQSMLDGQIYDSKSALRATYKQAGVEELGNDAPLTKNPAKKPDTKAIEEAVGKSLARVGITD